MSVKGKAPSGVDALQWGLDSSKILLLTSLFLHRVLSSQLLLGCPAGVTSSFMQAGVYSPCVWQRQCQALEPLWSSLPEAPALSHWRAVTGHAPRHSCGDFMQGVASSWEPKTRLQVPLLLSRHYTLPHSLGTGPAASGLQMLYSRACDIAPSLQEG